MSEAVPTTTFRDLGVLPATADALEAVGIVHPFPIQEMTLPIALMGNDLIGQARTGTGKTLAFGIPLLQRIVVAGDRDFDLVVDAGKPQALVIAPTRELAIQVSGDIALAGSTRGARVLTVYGGRAYEPQLAALRKGVDVVVGTPGRLLDLAEQRLLVLGRVKALVLDEADEMLDLGFLPDVERIMRMLPEKRHTMLFSATMPGPIIALSRAFLDRPTHIRAEEADQGSIHERTRQLIYRAHAMDKVELLTRVLQAKDRGLTMIFARTKRTAQRVADDLADRGFAAAAVHGDLGQGAREQALRAFRAGKVDVLVATDVAARGIDVIDVTHVVNYQCPEDSKTYVHRIGRTGRAGKEGVAVTLVDWDDTPRWKMISDELGLDMPEPVETYSTSDHLFTDLTILTGVKGRLPHSQRTRAGLDAEYVDTEGDQGGRKRSGDRNGRARTDAVVEPASRPKREARSRTRKRAGVTLGEGGQDGATSDNWVSRADGGTALRPDGGADTNGVTAQGSTPGSGPGADAPVEENGKPRRRRRRGGSRRRAGGLDGGLDGGPGGVSDGAGAPTRDAAAS